MSNQKYGPQTAEIKALIKQLKTITPDQALTLAGEHDPALTRTRESLDAALRAASEAERERMWYQAIDEAAMVSRGAGAVSVWDTIEEAVDDALLALVVGDLIDAEQFHALYGAWESVIDRQANEQFQSEPVTQSEPTDEEIIAGLRKEIVCHDATIQGLIAALAIKNEQLATAKRKIRRWKKAAKKAKAELAKFHLCYDSNGCYDEFCSVHIIDTTDDSFADNYGGEPMRTVWHKDGE
jgi:hypothetical protein